jgi:hypothetical protein
LNSAAGQFSVRDCPAAGNAQMMLVPPVVALSLSVPVGVPAAPVTLPMTVVAVARDYAEFICLATEALEEKPGGPILRVADIASTKIDEAVALLNEYRAADAHRR